MSDVTVEILTQEVDVDLGDNDVTVELVSQELEVTIDDNSVNVDIGDNEVTVEITGGGVGGITAHSQLSGIGTNTHSQIDTHVDGDGSDHSSVASNTALAHAESHTIASHSDTTATGAELEELTDGSETTLHSHAGGGGGSGDLKADGTVPMTADLDFDGNQTANLADATSAGQAIAHGQSKSDSALAGFSPGVDIFDHIDRTTYQADILARTDTSGADHSTAIMAANDDAVAQGVPLIMPEGTYNVAGATQIDFTSKVIGAGISPGLRDVTGTTTIQWKGSAGGDVVRYSGRMGGIDGIHIDCGLVGESKAARGLVFNAEMDRSDFNVSVKGGYEISITPDEIDWSTYNFSGNHFKRLVSQQLQEDVWTTDTTARTITASDVDIWTFTLSDATELAQYDWLILNDNNRGGQNWYGTSGNTYTDAAVFQIKSVDTGTGAVEVYENYYVDKSDSIYTSETNARIAKYPGSFVTNSSSTAKKASYGNGIIPFGHHDTVDYIHCTQYNCVGHALTLMEGDQNWFGNITIETPYQVLPADNANEGLLLNEDLSVSNSGDGAQTTDTSMVVSDASKFPDLTDPDTCAKHSVGVAHFYVWLTESGESEVVRVTAQSATTGVATFTIVRAVQEIAIGSANITSVAYAFTTAATVTPILGWNGEAKVQPYSDDRNNEAYTVFGPGTHTRLPEFAANATKTTTDGQNGSIVNILTIGRTGGGWHIGGADGPVLGVRYKHLDRQHAYTYIQEDDTEVVSDADSAHVTWEEETGVQHKLLGTEAVFGEDVVHNTTYPQWGKSNRVPDINGPYGYSPPSYWGARFSKIGEALRTIIDSVTGSNKVDTKTVNADSNYPLIEWHTVIDPDERSINHVGRYRTAYNTYEDYQPQRLKVNDNPVLCLSETSNLPNRVVVTSGGADTSTTTINADASAGTFTVPAGGLLANGFRVRDYFDVTGFAINPGNNAEFQIASLTDTVITVVSSTGMVTESGAGIERIRGERVLVKPLRSGLTDNVGAFEANDIRLNYGYSGTRDVSVGMYDNGTSAVVFGLTAATSNTFFRGQPGYGMSFQANGSGLSATKMLFATDDNIYFYPDSLTSPTMGGSKAGIDTDGKFYGDGSNLTGISAFDQDLNTTDSVQFVNGTFTGTVIGNSDGSNETAFDASNITTGYYALKVTNTQGIINQSGSATIWDGSVVKKFEDVVHTDDADLQSGYVVAGDNNQKVRDSGIQSYQLVTATNTTVNNYLVEGTAVARGITNSGIASADVSDAVTKKHEHPSSTLQVDLTSSYYISSADTWEDINVWRTSSSSPAPTINTSYVGNTSSTEFTINTTGRYKLRKKVRLQNPNVATTGSTAGLTGFRWQWDSLGGSSYANLPDEATDSKCIDYVSADQPNQMLQSSCIVDLIATDKLKIQVRAPHADFGAWSDGTLASIEYLGPTP